MGAANYQRRENRRQRTKKKKRTYESCHEKREGEGLPPFYLEGGRTHKQADTPGRRLTQNKQTATA